MKLATFTEAGVTRIGVVDGTSIVDLSAAAPELPHSMRAFLGVGLNYGDHIEETVCTLEPGDVISTGTPGGVCVAMNPRCFLNAGDVVKIEIAEIGAIEHTIVAAGEATGR